MSTGLLPPPLVVDVERTWSERLGRRPRIVAARTVPGGCISRVSRIETSTGDVAFLKWGEGIHARRMLVEEARSLAVLGEADAIRVPRVLAESLNDATSGVAPWLLLEWLEAATPTDDGWRTLGADLARLHATPGDAYGWATDNFIGSLSQTNPRCLDWSTFWGEHRIRPQLRRATDGGRLDDPERRRIDRLLERLEHVLAPAAAERPALLHGDLWSGNVHHIAGGGVAIIDPASYFGHREVDLAMAELFGGFPLIFHSTYGDAWPLQPEYRKRRHIYQLYYLLVHLNLFGAAYLPATRASLQKAGF